MGKRLSDDSIMREMSHMNQVVLRRARAEGGSTGVSLALTVLENHEGAMADGFTSRLLTQVELADTMGIRPQSIGTLLAQMERDGLAERVACESDRRAHLVALTDKGRAEAQSARNRQKAFAKKALGVLTAEEKQQLADIVMKLNASFD